MPCYHFIFHGYGPWMPDEDDGFVRRDEGRLPQDIKIARQYRQRMSDDEVLFDDAQQQLLIDEVHIASNHQQFASTLLPPSRPTFTFSY